jgi:antitoxin (DNA-binding transcriptional repressor) of toxin-antitoxin stability system
MNTITIQEAQAKLLELIHRLSPGDPVLITENDQPVALLSVATRTTPSTSDKRDWWGAVQEIAERQKQRGFVGQVADVDRDDSGYENRMSEICKDTMPRN